jgi:hypothetical protein
MLYPKGEFSIGETEKHTIFFKTGWVWGTFDVYVDGQMTQINGKSIVGEKHTLTFQFIFPAFFPVLRDKQVQVLVDGKLFKTF